HGQAALAEKCRSPLGQVAHLLEHVLRGLHKGMWYNEEHTEKSDKRLGGDHMSESFFSRGFRGRRQKSDESARIPPGQYLERGFPVLSAGPTPHTPLASWDFSILGEVDQPKR